MKCKACNGQGRVYATYADQMDYKLSSCSQCKGSGSSDNIQFNKAVAEMKTIRESKNV